MENQIKEKNLKELLSYDSYSIKHVHYNGIPIVEFIFINVRDNSRVKIIQGYETVTLEDGTHIYEDIREALNDFDILWKIETMMNSFKVDKFIKVLKP